MHKEDFIDYDPSLKEHCPYCNSKLDNGWESDFDCNVDYQSTTCPDCGKEQWIRLFKNTRQKNWASEEEEEESDEKTIEIKIRELQPNTIDEWSP